MTTEGVSVNGQPLSANQNEPHIEQSDTANWVVVPSNKDIEPMDVLVPDGMVFVLGDNRANSLDSRSYASASSGECGWQSSANLVFL